MPSIKAHYLGVVLCGVTALAMAPSAQAHDDATGGATADAPTVSDVRCGEDASDDCTVGDKLTVRGEGLGAVEHVVFMGKAGRRDNRRATPTKQNAHRLVLRVPASAVSGPLKVPGGTGSARSAAISVESFESTPSSATGFVFPIRGKYEIGESANQRFGGARGHQGQDIFAKCGKPIVAVLGGTVQKATYHGNAGNYVVVDGIDGRSYAYMHMLSSAAVEVGDDVAAGQPLGEVGETGRASGCHLHFELWTAPGWYNGGEPIDPYDELRAWEAE